MIVNLQTSRMIVSPLCCVGATDSNERRVLTIVAAVPARVLLAPLHCFRLDIVTFLTVLCKLERRKLSAILFLIGISILPNSYLDKFFPVELYPQDSD